MAEEITEVTFWVGGSGPDGAGAGYIGKKYFRKRQYYTTSDPEQIAALRGAKNVAWEIIPGQDEGRQLTEEMLEAKGMQELHEIAQNLHVENIRRSRKDMVAEILKAARGEQ